MELLYFAASEGNFGDDLNTWLWDRLLPGWRDWSAPGTLVGVGTILKQGLLPAGPKLVLGSGVGYGTPPDLSRDGPWDIRAVRGPRTAARLGLPPDLAIADAAVMLPRLPDFAGLPRGDDIVFVPHYKSVPLYDWPTICARAGVVYQSPSDDAHVVIRRLAQAGRVIGESMHATIIADAFGTPWRGVSITAGFNHFKWGDWAESLGEPDPDITQFFAPLRRAQGFVKGLRGTTPHAPAAAADPTAHHTPDSKARKLGPLLTPWAVRTLKAEQRKPFALSDRVRLATAQDRFAAMLDGVMADYAR